MLVTCGMKVGSPSQLSLCVQPDAYLKANSSKTKVIHQQLGMREALPVLVLYALQDTALHIIAGLYFVTHLFHGNDIVVAGRRRKSFVHMERKPKRN